MTSSDGSGGSKNELHEPTKRNDKNESSSVALEDTKRSKNPSQPLAPVAEKKSFFDQSMFLTVSGQLYGEMSMASLSKIYTFGPTFRAEHSHTTRHLAEFWMIEPEVAHAELKDLMHLAERLVKSVVPVHAIRSYTPSFTMFKSLHTQKNICLHLYRLNRHAHKLGDVCARGLP